MGVCGRGRFVLCPCYSKQKDRSLAEKGRGQVGHIRGLVTTLLLDEAVVLRRVEADNSEGSSAISRVVAAAGLRLTLRLRSGGAPGLATEPASSLPMAEEAIPSISTGAVGSRFISQSDLETAKARRDEQWKAAYARFAFCTSLTHAYSNDLLLRLGQEPPPPPQEDAYDGRSLAEVCYYHYHYHVAHHHLRHLFWPFRNLPPIA